MLLCMRLTVQLDYLFTSVMDFWTLFRHGPYFDTPMIVTKCILHPQTLFRHGLYFD